MPIGIIINALSIVIGGILGAFVGHKLSPKFKEDITLVFGVCSMGMGISTIGLMENMPACKAPKELVIVQGARHLCSAYADPELYQRTVMEFFEKYDGSNSEK